MSEGAGVLSLEDIHSHWRVDKSINTRHHGSEDEDDEEEDDDTADALLHVNEPAVIQPRGRPVGAKNKKKKRTREEAFEDSTQREPSRFEHVQ